MRTELKYKPLPDSPKPDFVKDFFKTDEIRTAPGKDGETCYVLRDVCKALELRATQQTKCLPEEAFETVTLPTSKGPREMRALTLGGMFDLATRVRTEPGKKFQKFVYGELLPTIERQGYWGNSEQSHEMLLLFRHTHELLLSSLAGRVVIERKRGKNLQETLAEVEATQAEAREDLEELLGDNVHCAVPIEPVDFTKE